MLAHLVREGSRSNYMQSRCSSRRVLLVKPASSRGSAPFAATILATSSAVHVLVLAFYRHFDVRTQPSSSSPAAVCVLQSNSKPLELLGHVVGAPCSSGRSAGEGQELQMHANIMIQAEVLPSHFEPRLRFPRLGLDSCLASHRDLAPQCFVSAAELRPRHLCGSLGSGASRK